MKINKGKMVCCKETFQVFPSVQIASEILEIGYHSIAKNAEGKTKTAAGKHFVYLENTADLAQLFTDTRKEEKQKEAMRVAAEKELAELKAMRADAKKQAEELETRQKEIAKKLAKAQRLVKKYM